MEKQELITKAYDYIGDNDKTALIIVAGKRQQGSEFIADFVQNLIDTGVLANVDTGERQLTIPDVIKSVCHCYNTECMHHRGNICMAAQFNCEDRQTGR